MFLKDLTQTFLHTLGPFTKRFSPCSNKEMGKKGNIPKNQFLKAFKLEALEKTMNVNLN